MMGEKRKKNKSNEMNKNYHISDSSSSSVYVYMYVCMYLIMNERTGSGNVIKKLLFSNFVPGIRNWFLFWLL